MPKLPVRLHRRLRRRRMCLQLQQGRVPRLHLRQHRAERQRTGAPAQVLLDRYHGEWGGDIDRVYKYSF